MLSGKIERKPTNRVTITIMGDEYNVMGPESPDYVEQLVATIEAKIDLIQKAHGDAKLSKTQLAILVALQITDELVKLRIDHEKVERLIQAAK